MARHSRRRAKRLMVFGVGLLLLSGTRLGWFAGVQSRAASRQPGLYSVTEFIDGDTVVVDMNGVPEKLRFIGVDTPETHDPRKAVQCYGQNAAAFTKHLIGSNRVRLEADPLGTNRDRYGRLLRYIFLPNGQLVNAEIIKQGYGFAYLSFPLTRADEFRGYQASAQASSLGLWASCHPILNDFGGYTSDNAS